MDSVQTQSGTHKKVGFFTERLEASKHVIMQRFDLQFFFISQNLLKQSQKMSSICPISRAAARIVLSIVRECPLLEY